MPRDPRMAALAYWARSNLATRDSSRRYNYWETLHHPGWFAAFLRGGRADVFRAIVADSIREVRSSALPGSLDELARRAPVTGLGKMGAIQQECLYYIVRMTAPDKVVETGVYRGFSTAFILAALEDNQRGRLWSIDLPGASYAPTEKSDQDNSLLLDNETTGYAIPQRLRSRWTLCLGDSRVELPRLLGELKQIDLFYHDSEHTYDLMSWEYDQAYRFLRPGGVLSSDDVDWTPAFRDFTSTHSFNSTRVLKNRFGLAITPDTEPG